MSRPSPSPTPWTGRRTRPSSSSPTPWAPPGGCGTRRCRRWPSGTAWSPTTPAGTGSPRRRPGRTRSTTSSTTWSPCSTRSARERAHVAGLSLGGMTAHAAGRPRAAAGRPAGRCCAPRRSPIRQPFLDRAAAVRSGGTAPARAGRGRPLADPAVRRRAPRPGRAAGGDDRRLRTTRATPPAARSSRPSTCASDLARITAPTLVVSGCRRPRAAAGAPAADRRRHPRRRTAHASAPAPTWPTSSRRCRSPARCSATSTRQDSAV